MIVVIEGVDGVGKSTLARWLEKKYGFAYFKSSVKPLSGMDNRVGQISDANVLKLALATGRDVVFDRFFPSQLVYDSYYDREVDEELVWEMDKLAGYDALGILLFHDPQASDDDWAKRLTDDEVPVEHLRHLQRLFFDYAEKSRMRWFRINAHAEPSLVAMFAAREIASHRPSKDETYMNLAREVARRATCLSRRNGAVLVSESGHVIATGYNGPPVGVDNPTRCPRMESGTCTGSALDLCHDVHSEENLLAQAASQGASTRGSTCYTLASPCHRCARMLINAGIAEVVYRDLYDEVALTFLKSSRVRVRKA